MILTEIFFLVTGINFFHSMVQSFCDVHFFLSQYPQHFQSRSSPIYDDVLASVRSIKKIKAIDRIEFLLSSWDDPKKGINAYLIMDEALSYLARIHEAVTAVDKNDISHDPMELCRLVLRKLKLPEMTANPLIARSFEAHRKVSDLKDLQKQ